MLQYGVYRCSKISRIMSLRRCDTTMFNPVLYSVTRINGDYAIMVTEDGVENTVAMALLPIEIAEGDKVLYEMLSYTIVK